MPTKAKRLASIALIFILIIPLFTVLNAPMPEAFGLLQNPDEPINFREHNTFAAANPFWRYLNSTGGAPANTFQQTTGTVGTDAGWSYVFLVFRGSLLNGATLNIRHSLAVTNVITYYIRIQDGSYDRESMVDFPNLANLLYKGNGLIQDLNTTVASFAVKTETYSLSFTNALTWVTLFFMIRDVSPGNNVGTATYYNMSIVRGSTMLFFTDFDGNVMCDLAEESMLFCSDNAWPDTFLNSSGYLDAGIIDIDPCFPTDFEIMNPSALAEDGTPWVYTETKYYFFNATYINFNLTGGDEASIRFSPDGLTNVTITYSYSNDFSGLLSVWDSADFITTTTGVRNSTGAFYNSTTQVLSVLFPVWFTDNSPDAQYVDVYYACTGLDYIDSGEDFHIYNQGGLVEREATDNGTFTTGGEWFEGCVFEEGTIFANQTWRKLQHFGTQFALKFYENVSGVWVPEDQFMQDEGHNDGGAEKWATMLDWQLFVILYGYDNVTSSWIELIDQRLYMLEGDEGADDEWIATAVDVFTNTGLKGNDTYNSFIEEEQAARFRFWHNTWINKIDASSAVGSRFNAYYFGMEKDPGWIVWGDWKPMLDNITEAISIVPLLDGNNNVTQARNYDLMKIGIQLIMYDGQLSSDPYQVCIEDININEVQLASHGEVLSGVNTPIWNAPKVPDMPIGGIIAPLYAAILSLGSILTDAVAGGLGVLWGMIDDRFPWFTAFWAGLLSGITDLATLFVTIFGWLSQLFAWGVNFIGLIATPITIIEGAWINIVDATASFAGVAPTDLGIVFIVMFGIIFPLEALGRGDASVMMKVLELTWAVARTFIFLMMRIGTFIVNTILGLIPF